MLFPQIAHFLAGSRVALAEWQAEGYREGFRRLSQLADQISGMSAKVTALPGAVVEAIKDNKEQKADSLLREFAQTLLNNLLLRLDLSPLRAERSLYGSLSEHFVVPEFRKRKKNAVNVGQEEWIRHWLCMPGARRVIQGGAGVGKSTCALWLQSSLLQAPSRRLAVLIRLRAVPDIESHSLLELMKKQAGVHLESALTDELLRSWHEAGKVVIILDGFDEVPETRRDAVEQWIKELGVALKQSSLIVTSRPLQSGHLEKLPDPWQQWDLLAFNEPRIIDFIQRWHRHLPEGELSPIERKVDANALAETFLSDPSLRPLADTPLMLGTLLFVHHRDKKLPSGRVDLYDRYVAAMLGLRDSGLGIEARATKLSDREKRDVLAHIALHFHWNSVNEVNDDTMRQLVSGALEKFHLDESPDCLLPALCERTGLIQGPGAWSFMHKTIGEFLVAELICHGTTLLPDGRRLDRKELWKFRQNDTWTSVLFFWAGKTSYRELEDFIGDLIGESPFESKMLALALIQDQGDRLPYIVQRTLALKLIQTDRPIRNSPTSRSICSDPPHPQVTGLCRHLGVDHYFFRGLSSSYDTDAFADLFEKGVLVPGNIEDCDRSFRDVLTVAALWGFSRLDFDQAVDLIMQLIHVPKEQQALFIYASKLGPNTWHNTSVTRINQNLSQWNDCFPFTRRWLPLLIVGTLIDIAHEGEIISDFNYLKVLGILLWERRLQEVDREWLAASVQWESWRGIHFDALKAMQESLSVDGILAWEIDIEKHADLLRWCNQLLLKRDMLTTNNDTMGNNEG